MLALSPLRADEGMDDGIYIRDSVISNCYRPRVYPTKHEPRLYNEQFPHFTLPVEKNASIGVSEMGYVRKRLLAD